MKNNLLSLVWKSIFIFLLGSVNLFSQHDSCYYSLSRALKHPDKVVCINLEDTIIDIKLSEFPNLEYLFLTDCALDSIESNMPRLKRLDMEGCSLKKDSIILKNFEKLEILQLKNCGIKDIQLYNMKSLILLNLMNNEIDKFSINDLDNLNKLTRIVLSGNELTSIPSCIFKIRSLSELILNNNKIKNVTGKFESTKNLKELDLSYNLFETLPVSLFLLERIERLSLEYNKINKIPKKIKFGNKNSLVVFIYGNSVAEKQIEKFEKNSSEKNVDIVSDPL